MSKELAGFFPICMLHIQRSTNAMMQPYEFPQFWENTYFSIIYHYAHYCTKSYMYSQEAFDGNYLLFSTGYKVQYVTWMANDFRNYYGEMYHMIKCCKHDLIILIKRENDR